MNDEEFFHKKETIIFGSLFFGLNGYWFYIISVFVGTNVEYIYYKVNQENALKIKGKFPLLYVWTRDYFCWIVLWETFIFLKIRLKIVVVDCVKSIS